MSAATSSRLRSAFDRVRGRLTAGTAADGSARPRPTRSIRELRPEVVALALAGVSSPEIARRTGLAYDAVGLILHLAPRATAENSAGSGTMFRARRESLHSAVAL